MSRLALSGIEMRFLAAPGWNPLMPSGLPQTLRNPEGRADDPLFTRIADPTRRRFSTRYPLSAVAGAQLPSPLPA